MAHFTPRMFRFLEQLQKNNNRDWFAAHKGEYEEQVRNPMIRFVSDFGPRLRKISKHLVADPRPVGGSMFRIYRDTRFSRDKSPYKTHVGVHFFHEAGKKAAVSVPGFYLHVAPEGCFAAAGIWHPDPNALLRLREAIARGTAEWKALKRSKLPIEGGSLKRPPRGFDPQHEDIESLKRTDFVTSVPFGEREICSDRFLAAFTAQCRKMTPIVKFTTAALELPF